MRYDDGYNVHSDSGGSKGDEEGIEIENMYYNATGTQKLS
jgi:hypothetical protein